MLNFFKSNYGCIYTNNNISDELYIYETGFEKCTPTKAMEYKLIDYYLFHYCIEGEGRIILYNTTQTVKKGDIFLIPPNTPNNYMPDNKNPWSYCWIGIKGTLCDEVILNCGFNNESFIRSFNNTNIKNIFDDIYISCLKNNKLKTLSSLYTFLDFINEKKEFILKKQTSSSQKYLKNILKFIHTNYYKDITITQIAKYTSLDRTYIFKLFKRHLNTSPSRYILNYRISKSLILIKNTTLPIQNISQNIGFNNYSHFSKEFKNKVGIPPSIYRKLYIN